jgi:putative hydrolase of the HAD superfamily
MKTGLAISLRGDFMPIDAVIFDYGKVLSNSEDPLALEKLIALTGLDRPSFDSHYWRHRHDYDLGVLNGRTYWAKVASDAGISFPDERIDDLIETDVVMWTSLNEEMLAWVVALQEAGIKTAILSNMGPEVLAYMRQEFGWLAHFQHHTWSCELGICKPDPAIYIHTCEKLGVLPQKALFLDDRPENIAAATEVGLNAVLFTSIEQLRLDLKARGLQEGLPVPGASSDSETDIAEKYTFDA